MDSCILLDVYDFFLCSPQLPLGGAMSPCGKKSFSLMEKETKTT